MQGSIHESVGRIGVANGTSLEVEGLLVGVPSSEARLELLAEIRANIQVSHSGPTTQPLQNSAADEINIQ